MSNKPKEYRFPMGGGRVDTVVSPFRGERPFSDRFERFAEGLARVVSRARFGATALRSSHNFYFEGSVDQELQVDITDEMRWCNFHGYRPVNTMMIYSHSERNKSAASIIPITWVYGASIPAANNRTLRWNAVKSVEEIDDAADAGEYEQGNANQQTMRLFIDTTDDNTNLCNFVVHSIRVDRHQVIYSG